MPLSKIIFLHPNYLHQTIFLSGSPVLVVVTTLVLAYGNYGNKSMEVRSLDKFGLLVFKLNVVIIISLVVFYGKWWSFFGAIREQQKIL